MFNSHEGWGGLQCDLDHRDLERKLREHDWRN